MNMQPIGDRVLLLPARAEMRSEGGIVLASKPQAVSEQGIVIAAGPDCTSGVYAGQRVVYAKGTYPTTKVDGQELTVVRDGDLMAVVEA